MRPCAAITKMRRAKAQNRRAELNAGARAAATAVTPGNGRTVKLGRCPGGGNAPELWSVPGRGMRTELPTN